MLTLQKMLKKCKYVDWYKDTLISLMSKLGCLVKVVYWQYAHCYYFVVMVKTWTWLLLWWIYVWVSRCFELPCRYIHVYVCVNVLLPKVWFLWISVVCLRVYSHLVCISWVCKCVMQLLCSVLVHWCVT